MSTVNSARDVELRIQRAQQQADIEAQREQAEEDRKQQILKDNPHILKYFRRTEIES